MCASQSRPNASKVIEGTSAWVEFDDDWFAQGATRLVYRGTFQGNPRREGRPCVVKVYKQEWHDGGQYAWKADESAYLKADEMAQLFNNAFLTNKPIEFVKPEITRINTLAACLPPILSWLMCCFPSRFTSWVMSRCPSCCLREKEVKGIQEGTRDKVSNVIPKNVTLTVEMYLEHFAIFSGNTGYVDPQIGLSSSAFSHYTYHASNGEILVCRLQGVRSSTRYIFTSPAIHSGGTELGVYGPTDLGKFGIVKFFMNHTCNALCTGLKLPQFVPDPLNETGETELMDKIMRSMPADQIASMNIHQLSDVTGVPLHEIAQAQSKFKLVTGESDDS